MRYIIPILLLILLVACPKPDEKLDPVFCDDGYHPCGPDSQECCLDTTSSQFTWTIDTIGTFRTILRDVEYVNENDIWVVGTINQMVPDSSGESMVREDFNIAHWDGEEWEMSSAYHGSVELYSITYFAEDDIWVSSGLPLHWDGHAWTLFQLWDMGIFDLDDGDVKYGWGTSSENMYFVGTLGTIVHYDGTSFTKIESGTDINLKSVSGTPDGEHVFVCGVDQLKNSIILHIQDDVTEAIYEGESSQSLPAGAPRDVSINGDTAYFSSEIGVWMYNFWNNSHSLIPTSGNYEPILGAAIHVSTPNDLFLMGARSEFVHFNGARWTSDFSVWGQFGYSGVGSYGMDVQGDHVVIVGYANGWQKGLIAHGRRN